MTKNEYLEQAKKASGVPWMVFKDSLDCWDKPDEWWDELNRKICVAAHEFDGTPVEYLARKLAIAFYEAIGELSKTERFEEE